MSSDRPKVPLYPAVIEGTWQKPLMLLAKAGGSRRSHWRLVESHFARWPVDEAVRNV